VDKGTCTTSLVYQDRSSHASHKVRTVRPDLRRGPVPTIGINVNPALQIENSLGFLSISKTDQRGLTPDGTRHCREPTKSTRLLLTRNRKSAPPMITHINLLAYALARPHLAREGEFPLYFAPLNFIRNRWSLLLF